MKAVCLTKPSGPEELIFDKLPRPGRDECEERSFHIRRHRCPYLHFRLLGVSSKGAIRACFGGGALTWVKAPPCFGGIIAIDGRRFSRYRGLP